MVEIDDEDDVDLQTPTPAELVRAPRVKVPITAVDADDRTVTMVPSRRRDWCLRVSREHV